MVIKNLSRKIQPHFDKADLIVSPTVPISPPHVNEVLDGFECGIGVDGFTTFEEKDIIEVYELKEVKRKLK